MPFYAVTARQGTEEWDVYDGTDYAEAEARAVSTHRRFRGQVYVSVLLDGGTWRDVKHVPGDLVTARLCEPSCCLHPDCGQVSPLSCYCVESMTPEEQERHRTLYA